MSVSGERRLGLEQEFFLVDERGVLSGRSEEFLAGCEEAAAASGLDPEGFAPECSPSMVEVNAPPASFLDELSDGYLLRVELAINAARRLGLRLYPLATYPLDSESGIRDEAHYQIQARAVGRERFAQAGRCAGAHTHLEVPPGALDLATAVSGDAPAEDLTEVLNTYNLATALDPAILALTRSCPYYAGVANGLATRTARYRGDPLLAPHGVYAFFKEVGGLKPYAEDVEDLVRMQYARYHAWLSALDGAGVDRECFFGLGGGLMRASSWNPVRLNPLGTVELRGLDSNYPERILAVVGLVSGVAERVRREGLTVLPNEETATFEVEADVLLVPGFERLSGDLFRAAMTGGVESPEIFSYLDSVFDFARAGGDAADHLEVLRAGGRYRTTEGEVLREYPPDASGGISEEKGLELVRAACDELERQVTTYSDRKATKAGAHED